MSMSRRSFSSFPGIQALVSHLAPHRARSLIAGVALALVVGASALLPVSPSTAYAAPSNAPGSRVATPFLTLPFVPTASMNILSGWYYSGGGGFHGGIDYVNGNVNSVGGWRTFPVIASADGEACGNCTSRQGNAVWIKHNVNGATYYTYYGHLASIAKGLPLGSQSRTVWVKRGQVVGMAGDTGASGALHLHYGLYNAASQPIDPYSIGKLRQYYPQPDEDPNIGWFIQ